MVRLADIAHQHRSHRAYVVAVVLLFSAGCQHDAELVTPAPLPEVSTDYRDAYCGAFRFTVITSSWMMGQPTVNTTTSYDGEVRPYVAADSDADFYSDDDSSEDPDRKITIQFLQQAHITSLLEEDGTLVNKTGYHYGHSGGFSHSDTLRFMLGGLGGLGGGTNYSVVGVRL